MNEELNRLAKEMYRQVSERLVAEVQARGAAGMSQADRKAAGASFLRAAIDDYTRARIQSGGQGLAPDDEDDLFEHVINELFEAGAVQEFLDDPTVMEINATGRTTWIVRTDG